MRRKIAVAATPIAGTGQGNPSVIRFGIDADQLEIVFSVPAGSE
ncbi:hypothetical protein [Saccharopolyspora gloriosae]|nr:hypothetical protein [Saccharopolyspora gloriosae]